VPSDRFRGLVYRALSLGPKGAAAKVVDKTARALSDLRHSRADARRMTYSAALPFSTLPLYRYLGPVPPEPLVRDAERIAAVSDHWLNHRFDLLGSGWVRVRHGMECRGLEGHRFANEAPVGHDPDGRWLERRIPKPNLMESQRIWRLVEHDYTPIDWQLDFKSGYRWSEQTWYREVRSGHRPGADIKVPWELGRMQHLPQLALAHALAVRGAMRSRSSGI
jgi:hypothetical protein